MISLTNIKITQVLFVKIEYCFLNPEILIFQMTVYKQILNGIHIQYIHLALLNI